MIFFDGPKTVNWPLSSRLTIFGLASSFLCVVLLYLVDDLHNCLSLAYDLSHRSLDLAVTQVSRLVLSLVGYFAYVVVDQQTTLCILSLFIPMLM